jgi:antitoxin MazE
MRVAKWGNNLAVRLPETVVMALKLKTGDEIEIVAPGARRFEVGRDRSREQALERLRTLKKPLPKGFRFDRAQRRLRRHRCPARWPERRLPATRLFLTQRAQN